MLEAAGLSVDWVELPAGATAIEQGFDNVLPAAHARRHPGAQGRAQGPGDDAGRQGLQVRQRAAAQEAEPLRGRPPVRSLPGVKTRFDNVDLVIVRENTEGLYSGIENEVVPGVVTSLKVATRGRVHAHRALRLPLRDHAGTARRSRSSTRPTS